MNESKLSKEAKENYKHYHRSGNSSFMKIPLNVILINSGSTVKHEMSKCLGGIMINKWGEIKITPRIVELLNELQKETLEVMKDFEKKGRDFITEAVANSERYNDDKGVSRERRVDLVELDRNIRYEFETNHNEKKPDKAGIVTITHYLWGKKPWN